MKARTTAAGLTCPADAGHGPLLEVDGRLRCVHQAHDGRPKTHPLGAAAATRSRFTFNEVLTASEAAETQDVPGGASLVPALSPAAGAGVVIPRSYAPMSTAPTDSGGRRNAAHAQEGLGL